MSTAICIKKADLFPEGVPEDTKSVWIHDLSEFRDLDFNVEPRSSCETDFSKLQIIPYITLQDQATKEIFTYQRGKASGEQRLAGRVSIGLGGHMEIISATGDLIETIAEEGSRELAEEVGLQVDPLVFSELISQGKVALMYNNQSEVDRVHLAVSIILPVDKEVIMSKPHEADIITRGQWLTFEKLQEMGQTSEVEIEFWSQMVLSAIAPVATA